MNYKYIKYEKTFRENIEEYISFRIRKFFIKLDKKPLTTITQ